MPQPLLRPACLGRTAGWFQAWRDKCWTFEQVFVFPDETGKAISLVGEKELQDRFDPLSQVNHGGLPVCTPATSVQGRVAQRGAHRVGAGEGAAVKVRADDGVALGGVAAGLLQLSFATVEWAASRVPAAAGQPPRPRQRFRQRLQARARAREGGGRGWAKQARAFAACIVRR
jgi:hypothetical protein